MTTIADLQAMSIPELKKHRDTKVANNDEFYAYCIHEIIKSKSIDEINKIKITQR
jgi:hypothetical protein